MIGASGRGWRVAQSIWLGDTDSQTPTSASTDWSSWALTGLLAASAASVSSSVQDAFSVFVIGVISNPPWEHSSVDARHHECGIPGSVRLPDWIRVEGGWQLSRSRHDSSPDAMASGSREGEPGGEACRAKAK